MDINENFSYPEQAGLIQSMSDVVLCIENKYDSGAVLPQQPTEIDTQLLVSAKTFLIELFNNLNK